MERSKSGAGRVAVVADAVAAATALETVLLLWDDVLARRTPAGWEVADLLAQGHSQTAVAAQLSISTSAVSQRVSAAGLSLSARARRLAVSMLDDLAARSDAES